MSYVSTNSPGLLQKLYLAAADDQNLAPFLSEFALAYNASLATIATMEGPSRRDGLRVSGCANASEEAPRLPEYYAVRSPFRPIMMLEGNLGRVLTSSTMLSRERQARERRPRRASVQPGEEGHEALREEVGGEEPERRADARGDRLEQGWVDPRDRRRTEHDPEEREQHQGGRGEPHRAGAHEVDGRGVAASLRPARPSRGRAGRPTDRPVIGPSFSPPAGAAAS